MAGTYSGGINEVVATQPPPEVVHPHGRTSVPVEDGTATTTGSAYIKRKSTADVEAIGERTASVIDNERFPQPTDEEYKNLRKVADSIPLNAYLLCLIEFMERASYYGAKTVFSNFMQFPLPKGGNGAGAPPKGSEKTAGALGKGLQFSNAFTLLFTFLAYVFPIPGGWWADAKIGRFKAIVFGVLLCLVAHAIMTGGAAPAVLQRGQGQAPFYISFFLLAIGAGIFKPNVAPLIMDQYKHQKPYTRVEKSGERVVVDPESTIQRIMLWFYMLINVGAFFALATTYTEKYVGFWLSYLLPTIFFAGLCPLLWYLNSRLVKEQPDGTVLTKVWKITACAIKYSKGKFWSKKFWDTAKPSVLADKGVTTFTGKPTEWTEKDVTDIKRTLQACAVFLYFPIYNLNDGGIGSVATSQGSTMTTNGAPNDLLSNFNPLTIIVAVPLLSHVIYPALRRYNIRFGRISRITLGFVLATISGIIGAIIQWKIYQTSPCGYHATGCEVGTGVSPLSVWLQIPNVALGALSECFCNVTAYELAYSRAPQGMKSLVYALFLFTMALSSALGEIVSPAIADPHLIWVWAGPAIALAVQTVIFWFRYKHMNDDEFMTYDDDAAAGNEEDKVSFESPSVGSSSKDAEVINEKTKQ
ncbi:POT family protein [Polychaeton citri CBS 116435]|uniref:POT family protein n=1 Tax=Polychaeton citri CBS 116435 TaxID=1314669 RepID=A0A9P4UNB4_9PEZI|nr:POT family protein [Polychaeton citri CBS 116435]